MAKQWIAVDLDGTLAKSPKKPGDSIGAPIAAMVDRIKKWHEAGVEVRIFTARASDPSQVSAIRDWLSENGLPKLTIVANDPNMAELWSDTAIRVQRNTGRPCNGCADATRYRRSSRVGAFNRADDMTAAKTDC